MSLPANARTEAESSAERRAGELSRRNDLLRGEVRQLREECTGLAKRLATAQVSSDTDRESRRAALNLMEDAVDARAAEQRGNARRRSVEGELREADRRKDEFLATLAHELRNPLAPIRNSAQILRTVGTDAEAASRVCDMLDRQVNHMVCLVDDLMEVSRITRGQIELHAERVELAVLVRNALEISTPQIEAARHQLTVTLPEESLPMDGDPVRLTQVFANLLNNAARYTPAGGRISLEAACQGSEIVVAVRDNGVGIPADMLPRVFDLFIQGDRRHNRSPGGLGIGPTLVQKLVELHGGSVTVSSGGIGRGSEFVVRLPLAAQQQEQVHSELQPAERQSADVATHRILVVDDNRDAANSLGMLLRFLGADVTIVHDGRTALEALRAYRPDVALLDIGMPEMDGNEVARLARQRPEGQGVVLIALTGWGQDEDRRRSKEAGFDHHLVKPVDLLALQALLNSLSNGGGAADETNQHS